MSKLVIPPYLEHGDVIGLTCPAGFMPADTARICIETLQKRGFGVMVGKTLGSSSLNYFSGTDEERRNELQAMLDDNSIRAILFGRGGYGMSRIIDKLNFRRFVKSPKWLIGYSDITVLHNHILANYAMATLHAPMAAAFNDIKDGEASLKDFLRAITGKKASHSQTSFKLNRKGEVAGILTGGNLSLLVTCIGTASDMSYDKKILFIEDIGEYLYKIDRMLQQLKRAGKFKKLGGLIVGGFTDVMDTPRPFGKKIEEIIKDAVSEFDFPVCFNFPVSHTPKNTALKIGCRYALKVTSKTVSLREL